MLSPMSTLYSTDGATVNFLAWRLIASFRFLLVAYGVHMLVEVVATAALGASMNADSKLDDVKLGMAKTAWQFLSADVINSVYKLPKYASIFAVLDAIVDKSHDWHVLRPSPVTWDVDAKGVRGRGNRTWWWIRLFCMVFVADELTPLQPLLSPLICRIKRCEPFLHALFLHFRLQNLVDPESLMNGETASFVE